MAPTAFYVGRQAMTRDRPGTGHDRCAARTRSGGTCGRPAGWGTSHPGVGRCKLHGGSTPSHQIGAHLAVVEREAGELLARLGKPEPLGHPVEELLARGAECRARQQVLRQRVAELSALAAFDTSGTERERAAVVLYERSLDRLGKLLVDLARLDLDARMIRLSEQQTAVLGSVLCAVMDDLGVSPAIWQPVAAKRLRTIGSDR